MAMIEGAGVPLSYAETGSGSLVLVIHGQGSDALAWRPIAERLAEEGLRAVAYDRRGYGGSGAPEPYAATTIQEQGEDAATLLRGLGAGRALLIGDDFGALVALDVLVRHGDLARGAVLCDPPLFAFVPEATEPLAAQRQGLEQALRDGGPQRAVAWWLGDRVEGEALERACAAHRGFFADYGGLASWSPSRRELRGLAVPVAIVTRKQAPPHVVAAADAVTTLIPGARRSSDGDVLSAAALL